MKAYFQNAGSVPGLHQVCSPLILPANKVMEWDPSFPMKVGAKYISKEYKWKKWRPAGHMGVLQQNSYGQLRYLSHVVKVPL